MRLSGSLKRETLRALARRVTLRRALAMGVRVARLEVPIRGLPPALEGFTIAHVSDLHVGEGKWKPVYTHEAARLVRAIAPDAVVNTGDYLQGQPPLDQVIEIAREFVPTATNGLPASIGVFGNHDFYAGEQIVADLQSRLTSLGVTMLVNRATCIAQERGGISVVGLTTEAPGFEEAVDRLLESARPRIALMHEPDLAERLPPDSADLILAGHTHGGQITLPGLEAIIVRLFSGSSYVQGMYRVNGMRMYVNRGLGSTGMPLRFRAHPEVAVIRLAR